MFHILTANIGKTIQCSNNSKPFLNISVNSTDFWVKAHGQAQATWSDGAGKQVVKLNIIFFISTFNSLITTIKLLNSKSRSFLRMGTINLFIAILFFVVCINFFIANLQCTLSILQIIRHLLDKTQALIDETPYFHDFFPFSQSPRKKDPPR